MKLNALIYALPLATLFFIGGLSLNAHLKRPELNLIKIPIQAFSLEGLQIRDDEKTVFSEKDFPARPFILNIFSSRCTGHIVENRRLQMLADEYNIPVYGIVYKDTPENIKTSLLKIGNPYRKIALDKHGSITAQWGVDDAPQSLMIDAQGNIRYHHKSMISENDIETVILPVLLKISKSGP